MKEDETIDDHQEFKSDSTGQILKYKVLIKDGFIHQMLYNSDSDGVTEIPYNEKKYVQNELITIHNEQIFGDNVVLAEIIGIPR